MKAPSQATLTPDERRVYRALLRVADPIGRCSPSRAWEALLCTGMDTPVLHGCLRELEAQGYIRISACESGWAFSIVDGVARKGGAA